MNGTEPRPAREGQLGGFPLRGCIGLAARLSCPVQRGTQPEQQFRRCRRGPFRGRVQLAVPGHARDQRQRQQVIQRVDAALPLFGRRAGADQRDPLHGGSCRSWSAGGRLTRPLLFGLDEVTQICPVDLPTWLADSGGKGIQIIAVAHGTAQLRRRWQGRGDDGGSAQGSGGVYSQTVKANRSGWAEKRYP